MDESLAAWLDRTGNHETARWDQLPDLDLYMDQVITYLEKQLDFCKIDEGDRIITSSMINNYVKYKTIPATQKKKYSKKHLAALLVTCALKQVLPIPDIGRLINHPLVTAHTEELFDRFAKAQDDLLKSKRHAVLTQANGDEYDLLLAAAEMAVKANIERLIAIQIIRNIASEDMEAPKAEKPKRRSKKEAAE